MMLQSNKISLKISIIILLGAIKLSGCAVNVKDREPGIIETQIHKESSIGQKGFNHKVHIALGSKCKSCHPKVSSSNEAGMPNEMLCSLCHITVYDNQPVEKIYTKKDWQRKNTRKIAKFKKIKLSHQKHYDAGINCNQCHGDVEKSTEPISKHTFEKKTCFLCHKDWKAVDKCSTCHNETIKSSHPQLWGSPENNHCYECHIPVSEDGNCNNCHISAICTTDKRPPTRPYDLPHSRPLMCRACHSSGGPNLTHADNGRDCRFCHKLPN